MVEHRSPKPRVGGSSPSTPATASDTREVQPKISPFQFIQQVRQEVSKVTWPSRRETMITTIMVLIMSAFAGLFFFVVDQAISFVIRLLLGMGS